MTKKIETVLPYSNNNLSKKQQVEQMFDNIAPSYDLLNHTLSVGIDRIWRRKSIKILLKHNPQLVLDIATGTGDFAIELANNGINKIIGIDISEQMLSIAYKKVKIKKISNIEFFKADSEDIKFDDNTFDAATVAFGVRNFENIEKGMSEILRVLKPGALLIVLELSEPENFILNKLYKIYFKGILPVIGKLISKDYSAYKYLPNSVNSFPYGVRFLQIMKNVGYKNCSLRKFTFGIATGYYGYK